MVRDDTGEAIRSYNPERKHSLNERCTQAIARKVVKPGNAVIDLGANEGYHTFNLAALVGSEGMVHAFEPNPDMWPPLLDRANIRLWPVAVGDRVSVENFYVPKDRMYHQVGSLVDPRDFIGSVDMRVLSVPQVSLDALEELKGDDITFVKMDIERREHACLLGMRSILAKSAPIIVFENLTDEIEALLAAHDYTVRSMIAGTQKDLLANVLATPRRIGEAADLIPLDFDAITNLMSEVEAAHPG